MDDVTDRQRQAEALANAQIPGLSPEATLGGMETARDVIDVSVAPSEPLTDSEVERITIDVIGQLKSVYDPEIPVDIYELGLIYKVELEDDRTLKVDMTLTAPGVAGVRRVEVNMTFDPPWTPDRMSEEARLELNML